jgi:heterodisulfide reductase subunit B
MSAEQKKLPAKSEIKRLESLLDKDPSNFDVSMQLSELYNSVGNKVEANALINKMFKKFPKKAFPHIKMAEFHLEHGETQRSYEEFRKAVDLEPENLQALLGLLSIYKELKAYTDISEIVEWLIKIHPENEQLIQYYILSLFKSLNYTSAEEWAGKLKSISKNQKTQETQDYANYYLGLINCKKKFYKKAIEYLTQIPEPSKYYRFATHNLALAYSDSGIFDKAEIKFMELLKTPTESKDATSDVKSNEKLDEKSNTNSLPKDIIKTDPKAWINFGLLYEKMKKFDQAVEAYEVANQLQNASWPWLQRMKDIFIDKIVKKIEPAQDKKQTAKENETTVSKEKETTMSKDDASNQEIKKLKYALYLGCVIPNRYPMIEAATRIFLKELGVDIDDMVGASCCPAPGVFRSFDIPTWLTIGARNITIAEQMNDEVLTLCNGCYGTLLEVDHRLKNDQCAKDMVNEHLQKVGREFKGSSTVKHIVEAMYFDIGIDKLKYFVKKKLDLDVAVHYGCHILKPSDTKPWNGEVEDPRFLDELVELTGCRSVPYKNKMQCCGAGGGVRTAVKEVSLDFTYEKLRNVREAGAQAIITCCPFCQLQFDLGQMEVNNLFKDDKLFFEPFKIPIIYITQLFDYSFGKDPYDIGLLRPNSIAGTPPFIDTTPIFEKYYEII